MTIQIRRNPFKITLKQFALLLIFLGFLLSIWYLFAGGFIHLSFIPQVEKAKEIQPFMTGIVAPIFSLAGTLLVFENLRNQNTQQFSNIFFGMLNLHHKIIDNIKDEIDGVSEGGQMSKDRMFFDDLAFRIYIDYYGKPVECINDDGTADTIDPVKSIIFKNKKGLDRIRSIYLYYFHIHNPSLSHYFRSLFHIVNFVDRSKISYNEKFNYIKILRAQLSSYEILMLAYNCLCSYGVDFKPLVEKYELLKNLSFEDDLSEEYYKRIIDLRILMQEYPHLKREYDRQAKVR